MKTLSKYIYFLLCMPLLLTACLDDIIEQVDPEVPTDSKLEIIKNVETFSAEGGTQEVEFIASHFWKAEADQAWCIVSPASGIFGERSVSIRVLPNESSDERNTKVTFTSGNAEAIITVVQKQKDALLLTSSKADVPSEGKKVSVEVKANLTFNYAVDEAAKGWIVPVESRGMGTSVVTFNVKKNNQVEKREGRIYFRAGNLRETFTVYQEGEEPRLVLTKKEYVVNYSDQHIQIDIQSNIPDYKMIMPDVDWLSESKSRKMSTYSRIISVRENNTGSQRSAVIQFVCGDKTDSVMIIQKSKDAIALLENDTCRVEAQGGPLCFDVSSNIDFTVEVSEPWIRQLEQSKGMVESRLCFQVEKNMSPEERKAEIILEGGQAKQVVTVIQEGFSAEGGLSVLNSLDVFNYAASTQTLEIKASEKWKVEVDQSWCTVTPAEGVSGEYSLEVSVDANTTVEERSAQLKFNYAGKTKVVTITQEGKKVEGRFVMRHSNINCHIPIFSVKGGTPIGTVDWGDFSTDDYFEGITHEYIDFGTYEVVIQLDKATKVEMKDLQGIELIDFSSF